MTIGLQLGVREDAHGVMARARHVAIDAAAVARVAADMAGRAVPVPTWNAQLHFTDATPVTAQYMLVLDGLNFSFWGEPRWGITYRGEQLRGYWALAAALKRALEAGVPLADATWLAAASPDQVHAILHADQAPGQGPIPLFAERVAHVNQLGRVLLERYDGQFVHAIAACGHSAPALAALVARDFPCFADTSRYDGREVRIYKRAQILPADLWGAYGGQGWGRFDDIAALTAFADYKVPQVLERLGILRYTPELIATLRAGTELPHGCAEEVELRMATVEAVERLRAALAEAGRPLTAVEVDWILWEMGLVTPPDALPYHLTRTTAY